MFHFTAGPLLVWLFGTRTPPQPKERIFYAASSALRIARRPKPVPPRRAHPQPKTARFQPHPTPQPVTTAVRQRHELARIDRRATVAIASPAPPRPPAVHPVTMQDSLQRDEARFQKTIARLREENNPVISAARPVPRPEAPRRVTYDFAGSMGSEPQAEGILTPEQRWRDGPYNYYRVRYWVQYADGTTETGRVPWPIRYLPDDDPFARHYEHFPLPGPLPDFTLPAGFSLHPLVAFCYSHRFALCPIAHA